MRVAQVKELEIPPVGEHVRYRTSAIVFERVVGRPCHALHI